MAMYYVYKGKIGTNISGPWVYAVTTQDAAIDKAVLETNKNGVPYSVLKGVATVRPAQPDVIFEEED